MERRRLGERGERRAAAHLRRRGWRIVARNLRVAGVEIDLVARRGDLLVAVEVKTRTAAADPAVAVGAVQRRRLAGAIAALAARRPELGARRLRVDLVLVGAGPAGRIRHLPGIAGEADGGGRYGKSDSSW